MTSRSITAAFPLSVMDGTMRQQKPTLREQTVQLWSELRQTAVCLTTISYQTTGILYSTEADILLYYTGLLKKMDGIWNRYNLKSTGRIYTFCILKCSEKFKVLDLP